MPNTLYYLALAIVVSAAFLDIFTRRIPNLLTVSGAVLGLALHGWYAGVDGITTSLLGLLIGFLILLPGYLLKMTGAGDLKLMAAVGALVGSGLILKVFVLFALTAMGMALSITLYDWATRRAASPLARTLATLKSLLRRAPPPASSSSEIKTQRRRIPLAPAIAVGAIAAPFLSL